MDFLAHSFRVGRVFGIDIRVHILFVIWIVFRLIQAGESWTREFWFLGMLFGIVLLHELGHCFGARSVGGDARNILMWPLGGLAYAHAPMTPWAQFVTVAAGPLVNVIFCAVSGVVLIALAGTFAVLSPNPFNAVRREHLELAGAPDWAFYVALFYHVNYFLLALNLLPIYPLDGGQLFQTIIWPFLGLQRATEIACKVGIGGCVLLGFWGVSGGGGGMLIFIALFGGMTCYQRLQALKYGMIVDERIATFDHVGRSQNKRSWWERFKRRRRRAAAEPSENPNPGAWEERVQEREDREAEVDRILRKVHTQGVHSLTYIERQTLERATRERQQRDRLV